MKSCAVKVLRMLPYPVFVLLVKTVQCTTSLLYDVAKEEDKSRTGLSKKHLLMLAEIYENNKS